MSRFSFNWFWLVGAWICVVFFSSTSLASEWAEEVFGSISGTLFSDLHRGTPPFDLVHFLADKGFHVALFCIFAILLWQALPRLSRKPLVILLAGAILGCCSEILQRFFPDRDPAIRDVFINIGGTALGVGFCLAVNKMRSVHQPEPLAAASSAYPR